MTRTELVEKMKVVYCAVPGYSIRKGMSRVLDLLTKEADPEKIWRHSCGIISTNDMSSYNEWTRHQAIILDLPSAPSATKRAAEQLRAFADHALEAERWDMNAVRTLADELEKEACDAADGS